MSSNKQKNTRWRIAQSFEQSGLENKDNITEWLIVRRLTWQSLLDLLDGDIPFDNSKRILDIGCGPTSIFLSLRTGQKYALDPNIEYLFKLHPFMRDVEEYKDVTFLSSSIEKISYEKQFDTVFMINMLDHVNNLESIRDKIYEILKPGGSLVIVVDCYPDILVREIIRRFDVDLPHPHHFIEQDIIQMFNTYKLQKNCSAQQVFSEANFKGQTSDIEFHRLDRFLKRMKEHLMIEGKGNITFTVKYLLCYTMSLSVGIIRR